MEHYPGGPDVERPAAVRPCRLEPTIRAPTPASWAYAETFVPEDEVLAHARARAGELGCPVTTPGAGAVLSVLAAALRARAVVEIDTGTGVSGLCLLRGMPADGVLTTIDAEVENQRAAREAFTEAGVRPNRTRMIPGHALDVMPRLTDSAYDLVLLQADTLDVDQYMEQAVRLLRPGGMLAVDGALYHDKVADPALRDPSTTSVRELVRSVREHKQLLPALLPTGGGLLLAVKR